jgi:hypothetical protein
MNAFNKRLFIISLCLPSAALAVGGSYDGSNNLTAQGDSRYVNSPSESVAQEFTGALTATSSVTFTNASFSVGGSTFVVNSGNIFAGIAAYSLPPFMTISALRDSTLQAIAGVAPTLPLVLNYPAATNAAGTGIGFGVSGVASTVGAKIVHIRTGSSSTGDLAFYTRNDGTTMQDATTEKMRILATGNMGIGIVNPSEKLDVSGNISLTGQIVSSGTGNNQIWGAVTIGTIPATAAGVPLSVRRNGAASTTPLVVMEINRTTSNTPANGDASRLQFIGEDDAGALRGSAYITAGLSSVANGSPAGFLQLGSRGAPLAIHIENAGFIGIGNVTPTSKLHLSSGTIMVDGNVNPSIVVNQSIQLAQVAATAIATRVPGALGAIIMCTNCTNPYTICASTHASTAGSWIIAGSAGSGHCQ